ncbi:hypothetical protein HUB98_10020 [Paenibacillus barcinonensis]|uniref:Uncharacterized protein n=1 Tax=Paenibacillus barcinonensis TaxID=198119 RepID=A0A2V4WDU6_PAEBA|nr:hypothetical protein [Paenibacillus barcinonensis]PYE49653.1 hypothetical protein DFQ00_105157 [Paenibacillus barcinonensis]QKS56642.1 hypothetical protein HUB98_10020 [Paenibacillus barcinonensis]
MKNMRENVFTFIGNFVIAYFIFGEGTVERPLMFALWMFMLMMGMDWYRSRGSHTLN